MGSRYTSIKDTFYCFRPLHLFNNGAEYLVPCGKCDGCLLHRANEWSMRLGSELDNNANSIFFTLTYYNKYLPHLFRVQDSFLKFENRYDDLYPNVRFNTKEDVFRKDLSSEDVFIVNSVLPHSSLPSPVPAITNVRSGDYLPYLSKSDIQLYIKLLRKSIDLNFPDYGENKRFRYFIIGEYGPTTYRPHYHGVIICESHEVSEYLIECGLYSNWKMCDKTLFDQYTHYCDSGARGYVTQYLTCFTNLPKVYKCKPLKPFRLCSKNGAIGANDFDKTKVFEDVFNGIIEYSKDISRLQQKSLLRYPSYLIDSIFPKCFEYRKFSFDGLLRLYSRVYRIKRQFSKYVEKFGLRSCYDRLYPKSKDVDYYASLNCDRFVSLIAGHPFNYVYALDMCYYKLAMYNLKSFYESQDSSTHPLDDLRQYINFPSLVNEYRLGAMSQRRILMFENFIAPFGLHLSDFDGDMSSDIADLVKYRPNSDYVNEVEDIVSGMEKMAKFNILNGQSPNLLF